MSMQVPTFGPSWRGKGLGSFDAAFAALRSGEVESGTTVRVWCSETGGWVRGVLEWWCGEPSVLEPPDKC